MCITTHTKKNEMKQRSRTIGAVLAGFLVLGSLSAHHPVSWADGPRAAAHQKLNAHFPDFGFMVSPAEYRAKYAGKPVFRLKTDYPLDKPTKLPDFLTAVDFKKNPLQYLEAVRDYAFDGNLPDWDPYKNTKADWYHIPWLHPDLAAYPPNGGTEGFHGLIKEAGLSPLQLGPEQKGKPNGYSVYAITLVNDPQDRTNTTTPFPPAKTQVNPKLKETVIFDTKNLPPQHLGWNGRLNGPADLNTTSCMSCHITAQYPQVTSLVPEGAVPDGGATPPQPKSWTEWMKWFQNVRCATSMDPHSYSTDFSFQIAISLTNFYKAKEVAGLMADQYIQPRAGSSESAPAPARAEDAAKGIDLTVPRKSIARDGHSR